MTTFKIGQTVQRKEGNRNTLPMELKSQIDVDYVSGLAARGYEYAVVKDVEVDHLAGMPTPGTITAETLPAHVEAGQQALEELDFALPVVGTGVPSAPRVHIGGSTCISCEG